MIERFLKFDQTILTVRTSNVRISCTPLLNNVNTKLVNLNYTHCFINMFPSGIKFSGSISTQHLRWLSIAYWKFLLTTWEPNSGVGKSLSMMFPTPPGFSQHLRSVLHVSTVFNHWSKGPFGWYWSSVQRYRLGLGGEEFNFHSSRSGVQMAWETWNANFVPLVLKFSSSLS